MLPENLQDHANSDERLQQEKRKNSVTSKIADYGPISRQYYKILV